MSAERLTELLVMLDNADRLIGRELLIRGRAGSWRVEIADFSSDGSWVCNANPQGTDLVSTLILAIEQDLGLPRDAQHARTKVKIIKLKKPAPKGTF